MYELYVDESYQRNHYYVAGVLVDRNQRKCLFESLEEIAATIQQDNRWSSSPEFHGHALMNGLDEWRELHENFGVRFSIYQKVMHAIRNSGARVYLEGVDVGRLNARYRYPDSPHEVVLRHLLERINEYCVEIGGGQLCEVFADMLPQQETFNQAIQGYMRVGTPGYRSQKLLCINGSIHFMDSRQSRGVQAADMSVYVLRRHLEEVHASKASRRAAQRLVNALGPALVYERKWLP